MKHYKVYKYIFPDGMAYVGVTQHSIQYRKDCGYQHNKRLSDAIRNTGWSNVQKVIIADGLSKDEAFKLEMKIIEEEHLTDKTKGYNISYGGVATFEKLKHTEEFKKMLSNRFKNRHYSEATLNKMKKAHEKERIPVMCMSGGVVVQRYDSLHSAAESVGGYPSNISRACNSLKPYKGFEWRFSGKEVV